MKISSKTIFFIVVAIILLLIGICSCDDTTKDDPWTNFDGSEIVCRCSGCEKKPVYSD